MANGAIYTLSYDVLKDFEPVTLLAATPQLIVQKRQCRPSNLKELIAWLKENPDKASQGRQAFMAIHPSPASLFRN